MVHRSGRLASLVLAFVIAVGLAFLVGPASAAPPPPVTHPELFYTVNSPPQLKVAFYEAAGSQIQVGTSRVVANLPAADGLAISPDGDLLVGGAKTGNIFKVNPKSGAVVTQPSGIATAFHVTVAPDGTKAWTAGLPGTLASVPLKPFGPGAAQPLHGDDQAITTVGFAPQGTFYTAGSSFGSGNFGSLNLATLQTKRILPDLRGAHGFTYDPFSKDILLFGSFTVVQIDPAHPDTVLSLRPVPNMAFDQGVADGQGHVLAASNTGFVVLFDYSSSGVIGAKSTKVSKAFLDTNLDDIAPLGQLTVASGAAASSGGSPTTSLALVGLVVLLVIGGVLGLRSRQNKGQAGEAVSRN
jgi:LPXTG-motif cell wall-anchored protein